MSGRPAGARRPTCTMTISAPVRPPLPRPRGRPPGPARVLGAVLPGRRVVPTIAQAKVLTRRESGCRLRPAQPEEVEPDHRGQDGPQVPARCGRWADEGWVRVVAWFGRPRGAQPDSTVAGRRPVGWGVARGSAPRSPGGE